MPKSIALLPDHAIPDGAQLCERCVISAEIDTAPAAIGRAAGIDRDTAKAYADLYRADGLGALPPVVVFHDENTTTGDAYYLADGLHRVEGLRLAKLDKPVVCNAYLVPGTKRDALLYAASANARHGKPRTADDKRSTVAALMQDDKIAKWSDKRIAAAAKVSADLVAKIRKAAGKTATVREGKDGKARKAGNSRAAAKERHDQARARAAAVQLDDTELAKRRGEVIALADALSGLPYPHEYLHPVKRQILAALWLDAYRWGSTDMMTREALADYVTADALDVHPGQLSRAGLIEVMPNGLHELTKQGADLTVAIAQPASTAPPAATAAAPAADAEPTPAPQPNLESRRGAHIAAVIAGKANQVVQWTDLGEGASTSSPALLSVLLTVGIDSGPVPPHQSPIDILAMRLARRIADRVRGGQVADLSMPYVCNLLRLTHADLVADAALSIPE